jgi:NAD+ synthetase
MIRLQRKTFTMSNPLLKRHLDYKNLFERLIINVEAYVNKKLSLLNQQNKLFVECENFLSNFYYINEAMHTLNALKKHFIIGISGGMDSAIVNFIISLIFGGDNIFAISMPTTNNSIHTKNKAQELSNLLKNNFEERNILIENDDCENDQALKRALILQKKRDVLIRANINQAIFFILNTSNLSEIQTGNFTINGDTIGDFGILRNLFKSEIYQFFDWINTDDGINFIQSRFPDFKNLEKILNCLYESSHIIPSAELKNNNQKDSDILLNHDDFYGVVDMILIGKQNQLNDNELKDALLKENCFLEWVGIFCDAKKIDFNKKNEIAEFAIKKINARIQLSNNKIDNMRCESI